MSYPINQSIQYTAVASTQGFPGDSFTYSWSFDDGTTGSLATLPHIWGTAGNHTATVTATSNQTGQKASASKTISCKDWTSFSWVNSGQKIIPSTSASSQDHIMPLIISGNLIINVRDYYTPGGVVSFDTVSMTRTENLTATSTLTGGGAACGMMLTTGSNAGKILVVSRGGLDYGFLDPNTLTLVKSSNSMLFAFNPSVIFQSFAINLDSTNILFIGANPSNSSIVSQSYNQITDTWTAKSVISGPPQNALLYSALVNNKLWVVCSNTTTTYVYDILLNVWSLGPTLPGISYADGPVFKFATRNGLPFFISYANPGQAYWWDGISASLFSGALFPLASLNGGVLSNISESVCETSPDGFIMLMNAYGAFETVVIDKTVLYSPYSDNFTVSFPSSGQTHCYRSTFLNGRFWQSGGNGFIFYTNPIW